VFVQCLHDFLDCCTWFDSKKSLRIQNFSVFLRLLLVKAMIWQQVKWRRHKIRLTAAKSYLQQLFKTVFYFYCSFKWCPGVEVDFETFVFNNIIKTYVSFLRINLYSVSSLHCYTQIVTDRAFFISTFHHNCIIGVGEKGNQASLLLL